MLLLGDNLSLIRACSLSSWLFTVTAHFIQGLFRLTELFKVNSSKKSSAELNICVSMVHRRQALLKILSI